MVCQQFVVLLDHLYQEYSREHLLVFLHEFKTDSVSTYIQRNQFSTAQACNLNSQMNKVAVKQYFPHNVKFSTFLFNQGFMGRGLSIFFSWNVSTGVFSLQYSSWGEEAISFTGALKYLYCRKAYYVGPHRDSKENNPSTLARSATMETRKHYHWAHFGYK